MGQGTFRSALPKVYEHLLPSFFDLPVVDEPRATCDSCAMCDKGQNPSTVSAAFFRPDIKCCTYYPTLPNYLVGSALDDARPGSAEGARRLRAVIARRVGVTPRWVAAPRKYRVLLDAARLSSFGRSESLLCPYYAKDTGRCTIWEHREGICATFFCKHQHGGSGRRFWMALKQWLAHTERTIAEHVARQIAPEHVEPEIRPGTLTLEDLEDRPPSQESHAAMFGAWAGREEELYVECFRRASALSADQVRELTGARGEELLAAATARHESVTSPKLAHKLRLNPDMPTLRCDAGVAVTPYSRYDSFVLPAVLYDALTRFGPEQSVDATLERLAKDDDLELARETLLELQVFEVMVPVEEA